MGFRMMFVLHIATDTISINYINKRGACRAVRRALVARTARSLQVYCLFAAQTDI